MARVVIGAYLSRSLQDIQAAIVCQTIPAAIWASSLVPTLRGCTDGTSYYNAAGASAASPEDSATPVR